MPLIRKMGKVLPQRQLWSAPGAGESGSGWEEDMKQSGLIFFPAACSKSTPDHSSWSWLFSPFFAVPFLSVLIAPNQFLRQCMMLQCATGMPVGTDLYNIFTDHFVSYESEILSGGFISWSPRWIVWEFGVLYLLFKNPLVYYTSPPEFSTRNQLEDKESRTWAHGLNQMWIWWSHYFLSMSFLKRGS